MEDHKEVNGRLSIPTFGEWDLKDGPPEYSINFSKIRENRLRNKSGVSIGNEQDLLVSISTNGEPLQDNQPLDQQQNGSAEKKKKVGKFFSCYGCMGA
ncbi:hypothetical protein AXF42_Ash002067 [Apostasia shenzhenica]|uniref:RIN4 pathogenic type III effector avirulence factor Avr cleavage site domain-containing protein n=1 Tax=Apostasia shenzhenica TaxID=1088818 RepID=A0A2I0AMK3_9ASPA|nr:hypothetical protein AXF42_Ash002067 [Apostasia shenzhenica]